MLFMHCLKRNWGLPENDIYFYKVSNKEKRTEFVEIKKTLRKSL